MNKTELPTNSQDALVFSIRNPFVENILDNNAYITKSISKDDLYVSGRCIEFGLSIGVKVTVLYKDGFLFIKTTSEVNLFLSGAIPADGIEIETKGLCTFSDGSRLKRNVCLLVNAASVVLDIPVPEAKFIALITHINLENAVHIKKNINTENLFIKTGSLLLSDKIEATKYQIVCDLIHNFSTGELILSNSSQFKLEEEISHYFIKSNRPYLKRFAKLNISIIKAKDFIQDGKIDFCRVNFDVQNLHLNSGSKSNFVQMLLNLDKLNNAVDAEVFGSQVLIVLPGLLRALGKFEVDGLEIRASSVEVEESGVIDGKTQLNLIYEKASVIFGKVSSEQTLVQGEQCFVAHSGTLDGKKLIGRTQFFANYFGKMSGDEVDIKTHFYLNLFGFTNYNSANIDCFFSIELGNVHTPNIPLPDGKIENHKLLAAKLNQFINSIPKSSADLKKSLPKDSQEAWQMLSTYSSLMTMVVKKISGPAGVVMSLSFAGVNLLIQLKNLVVKSFAPSKKEDKKADWVETLEFLLTLKNFVISGLVFANNFQNAFKPPKPVKYSNCNNVDQSNTSESTGTDNPEIITNVIPLSEVSSLKSGSSFNGAMQNAVGLISDLSILCGPNSQVNSLASFRASLNITWVDSRQSLFSFETGINAAFMQSNFSALQLDDHSFRFANTAILETRYLNQGGKFFTNNLRIDAHDAKLSENGAWNASTSTAINIENDLISDGKTNLNNGYVKVKGEAYFSESSRNHYNNMDLDFNVLQRKGLDTYSGRLSIEAKHIDTSLSSDLSATDENSAFRLHTKTSNLRGSEKHFVAHYDIENTSKTEVEELHHGIGMHANKEILKALSIVSNVVEDTNIRNTNRGENVHHSLTTFGNINVVEEINTGGLSLQSTNGNIGIQHDVTTTLHQNYQAYGEITKPSVTTKSEMGNISAVAGGKVDNSHGGKIYAPNGTAYVQGSSVDNDTYAIDNRSAIEARNVFVEATATDVKNRHGIIRGGEFAQAKAQGIVDNNPLKVSRWQGHSNVDEYHGGEILGGAGNESSNGYGVIVEANNIVNNDASTIGSTAHTYVQGRKGVIHYTRHSVYKAQDIREDHGALKKIYRTKEDVEWSPAHIFGDKNTIGSSDGEFLNHGGNILAANGSTVWSKGQHTSERATATLRSSQKTVRGKVFGSKKEKIEDTEHLAFYQTQNGPIDIISHEEGIKASGTAFLGSKETSKLTFRCAGDIEINRDVLNNQFKASSWSVNMNIAGQSIGGNNGDFVQRLSSFDQTFASVASLAESRSFIDALINGYSTIGGIDNFAQDIAANGLKAAIASRIGASVGFTHTKENLRYQVLGGEQILFFEEVIMDSKNGNVELGYDIDQVKKLSVNAKTFKVHGNGLDSSFSSTSSTITPTVSATGDVDVSASITHTSQIAKSFTQTRVNVGELALNVYVLDLAGAEITCEKALGIIRDVLITSPLIGTSSSESYSASASAAGNVNASHSSSSNETYDARGVLRVTTDDGMQLNINKHIEYGEEGIIDRNGKAIAVPNMLKEHYDVDLHNDTEGFSIGSNVTKIGDPTSAYTAQFGIDTRHTLDRISASGITNIEDSGHKFNFVEYITPEPTIDIKESIEEYVYEDFDNRLYPENLEQNLDSKSLEKTAYEDNSTTANDEHITPANYDSKEVSFREKMDVGKQFIENLEEQTGVEFTPEQKSLIRRQIKFEKDADNNFVISMRNGMLDFGDFRILSNMQIPGSNIRVYSSTADFVLNYPDAGFSSATDEMSVLRRLIKSFSKPSDKLGKLGSTIGRLGNVITFALWPADIYDDTNYHIANSTKEPRWVKVAEVSGDGITPPKLPSNSPYPALQPNMRDNVIPPTKARESSGIDDSIVSQYGSDPATMDSGPLITPAYIQQREDCLIFRGKIKSYKCSNGLIYEDAPYHGSKNNNIKNKKPTDPVTAMDNSKVFTENGLKQRRLSYDPKNDEIVVLDGRTNQSFHGHVRVWKELKNDEKAFMQREFGFRPKGKPPKFRE